MRKVTKEAEKCETCDQVIKREEEEWFCDECGVIMPKQPKGDYNDLDMTVYFQGDKPHKTYRLCTWKCIFKKLKKLSKKCDYFISLPDLVYNTKNKKVHGREFWKALEELK